MHMHTRAHMLSLSLSLTHTHTQPHPYAHRGTVHGYLEAYEAAVEDFARADALDPLLGARLRISQVPQLARPSLSLSLSLSLSPLLAFASHKACLAPALARATTRV